MWGSSLSCCLVSQVYNHQDRSKGKCCNLLHCVSFRTRPRVLDAFASLWGTRRVWEILHLSLNSFQLPGTWSAQWIASSSGGRGRKKPSGNQKLREFTSTKTHSISTRRIWFEPLVNTCFLICSRSELLWSNLINSTKERSPMCPRNVATPFCQQRGFFLSFVCFCQIFQYSTFDLWNNTGWRHGGGSPVSHRLRSGYCQVPDNDEFTKVIIISFTIFPSYLKENTPSSDWNGRLLPSPRKTFHRSCGEIFINQQ